MAALGNFYNLHEKNFDKAVKFYRAALKLRPAYKEAGLALCKILQNQSRHDEADAICGAAIMGANSSEESEWARNIRQNRVRTILDQRFASESKEEMQYQAGWDTALRRLERGTVDQIVSSSSSASLPPPKKN